MALYYENLTLLGST